MAILFDRDFGRVWSDGTTSCVFCSVTRVPNKEEMDELAEKQLQLIRELKIKFGYVYSILDLRLCPPIPSPIMLHYISNIMPLQFKAGVKHKALIEPEEKASMEVVKKALHLMVDLPISLHSTFEKALVTINQLRIHERTTWRQSGIGKLIGNLVQ